LLSPAVGVDALKEYEKPNDHNLRGMTANERLFTLGLLDEFGDAARHRNKNIMIDLLSQCDIPRSEAERIADMVLKDPQRYGF